MMKLPTTLIVNLSLRSIRTILFTDAGEKVFEDWLPVRTYINGSSVEQDPNEWWDGLVILLKKIFANKEYATSIKAITITSSALCLVTMDKNGGVLDKAYMVSDKRAVKESKLVKELNPSLFSSPSFKAEPSFLMPKMLWMKKNKPEIFKNATFFLSANDFLVYKLTKKTITDTLNAEKFYFDTTSNTYPKKLLKYLQITDKNLPAVVDPGTLIGSLHEDIKKELSVDMDPKVVISTYDAICALIGSSTHHDGELNNVCGTCSSYRILSKEKIPMKKNNLVIQNFLSENFYIIGGSNNLEGGVLEWAKECFYGDSYLKDDEFLYALLQSEAMESDLGAKGLLFLPYLLGERMPFLDPDVRGVFFGVERSHTRKDIIRSVFEAMAFQAKLMIEEFEKNGYPISVINMSGGVAKIPFAAQLRADVLGIPINVLSEVETTALGAFILSLKARGRIRSIKEASKYIKIEKQYIPNMHNHNGYASLFILYKKMYAQTKEMFTERKKILGNLKNYRKKVLEYL